MDRLVTLIGGGGFLGRYVAQALLKSGVRLRIAERDPRDAWFLKPQGGLGQTQFVVADITRPASLAAAVQGADAVVNLVGILKGNFEAIHVAGARAVAEAAASAGAGAFVQVSAIGADPASASAYGRSKAAGEAAVKAAFPTATIIRPSILFGREDDFVNRFARMGRAMPFVPVLAGATKLQPVHVADAARAIAAAATEPKTYAGRTFELGGPQVLSMVELNRFILETIGRDKAVIDLPDSIGALIAQLGFLPGAPITGDQWRMLQADNVVGASAEGFAAFGIEPAPMSTVAPSYLVQYRRHGRFAKKPVAQ